MNADYPLRFRPIFRRYLWGGRRLETMLGKPLPAGDVYAESWEVVDHGSDQSMVVAGPLSGTTLGSIVQQRGPALLGLHHPQPQFPLLFKFLDAQQNLSVQVHPNDAQAAQLAPPDRGKTEAWIVLHADPGSRIYAGLKAGIDRHRLEQSIACGTMETCLHHFEPQVGDALLILAGTVHALGAGLVIAEIQQSSDTTFRLYDWNRVGPDGRPRPLHVQQALDVIDFRRGPTGSQPPAATRVPHIQRMIACDKFVVDRWHCCSATSIGGDNRCHILAVLEGGLRLQRDATAEPLQKGDTALIPAAAGCVELQPSGPVTLLDIYLPV